MKKHLLKTICVAFLLAISLGADAQMTVRGTVVDATGEPVIGANIVVKGSTQGTITDFDGNYELEAADGSAVIVFSYIGMQPQEMVAKEANGKTITLKEDSEILEEVVVVGFGTQKKESLTLHIFYHHTYLKAKNVLRGVFCDFFFFLSTFFFHLLHMSKKSSTFAANFLKIRKDFGKVSLVLE